MALKLSTGLRNKLLDGTAGLKQILADGVLDIYSGPGPANADAAETGVHLVRITVGSATCGTAGTGGGPAGTNGVDLGTSGNGSISKNSDTWSGIGLNTGEAGWWRFYDTNIIQGTSGTAARIDGSCAIAGGDLVMADLTVTAALTTTINSFVINIPAF